MKVCELDCAWAAGFFEGEGHITISKGIQKRRRSPEYATQIVVTNTDPRPLTKLQYLFGGHIYERKEKGRRIPCFHWQPLKVNDQVKFLEAILPFLTFKHEEVRIGIAMRKSLGERQHKTTSPEAEIIIHREELRHRLMELNKRGRGKKKRNRSQFELAMPILRGKDRHQLELHIEPLLEKIS